VGKAGALTRSRCRSARASTEPIAPPDLLAVQMLPEWPSATLLLRAFVKVLASDKGIRHADAGVKLAAVEFTGQLASALCAEAITADAAADELQHLKEAAQAAAGAVGGAAAAAAAHLFDEQVSWPTCTRGSCHS
jgi:hypothetical protein